MSHSVISLGLGLGGGKASTSSGRPAGGGALSNLLSINFDGSNDFVETGYAPGASSGFSISMWIKTDNLSTKLSFASDAISTGAAGGFGILSVSTGGTNSYDNSFYVRVRNQAGTTSQYNSVGGYNARADVCDGNWHHLCFTINGNALKIYKDGGDSAGSNTQGAPYLSTTVTTTDGFNANISYDGNTGNPYFLGRNGAYTHSSNYWMDGNQDEVAMFEYELSGAQVSSIYNSGVPADLGTDGLNLSPTLWYRMGDAVGDTNSSGGTPANGDSIGTIKDLGSGSNDGSQSTASNKPTFSNDVPS
tara:strand:- start:839 stop:1750 length:912 start_codon:yes stop_codon:yes gene_type:complete